MYLGIFNLTYTSALWQEKTNESNKAVGYLLSAAYVHAILYVMLGDVCRWFIISLQKTDVNIKQNISGAHTESVYVT